MNEMVEHAMSLQHRLEVLRAEHHEIDCAILRLGPGHDPHAAGRLSQRKRLVHDRISIIERALGSAEAA